jgi:hypothetical protein
MNTAMAKFTLARNNIDLNSVLGSLNEFVLKINFVLRLLKSSLSRVGLEFPVEKNNCVRYFNVDICFGKIPCVLNGFYTDFAEFKIVD